MNGRNEIEPEVMEIDEKKKYLKRYLEAERREERIKEEIQALRADMMFPNIVNDGMPKGNEKKDLSEFVIIMEEEIEKLKKERLEKARTRKEIEDRIRKMKDETEKEVLRERYIKGMKWEKIALDMNYSWKWIHIIHSRALANFKI